MVVTGKSKCYVLHQWLYKVIKANHSLSSDPVSTWQLNMDKISAVALWPVIKHHCSEAKRSSCHFLAYGQSQGPKDKKYCFIIVWQDAHMVYFASNNCSRCSLSEIF